MPSTVSRCHRPYRMRLRSWALPVFSATILTVAACGGQSTTQQQVQGVTATTISLGTTLPLSGGAALPAAGYRAGIDAAVKEINAAGGINGRKFSLTVLDDGFEVARSVANFRQLGDDAKVYAIVVPTGSANIPGSWPYVTQKGILVWAPVLPPDPNLPSVFLLSTSLMDQARVDVDYLHSKGVTSIGFIGENDALGLPILQGVLAQIAKYPDMKVVSTQYTVANSTDISAGLVALRQANPQGIVLGTAQTQSGLIMKQAYQLGWHPIITGTSSTSNTGTLNSITVSGAQAATGMTGTETYELLTAQSPGITAWQAAMTKYDPDQKSSSTALQGYAYMQVFLQMVKTSGNDLSWKHFESVVESTKNLPALGSLIPPITGGPLPGGHTLTQGVKIAQWDGQKWFDVSPDWITYAR